MKSKSNNQEIFVNESCLTVKVGLLNKAHQIFVGNELLVEMETDIDQAIF